LEGTGRQNKYFKVMEKKKWTNLDEKEIIFLYDFLCEYETSLQKNSKGYDVSEKEVKEFIKNNQLEFKVEKKDSVTHKNSNRILFKKTKEFSHIMSFFCHLRNSIAHANFKKEGGYYVFDDYNRKGTQTLCGNIKCKLFEDFIKILKDTKEQKQKRLNLQKQEK
jgi:hypothetical protein